MTILCRYSLFHYSHSPQFFHLFHFQKIALVSPIAQPIETNLSIEFVLFTEPIESQLTIGLFLNFEQCRKPMKQFCHFYLQNKVSLTASPQQYFSAQFNSCTPTQELTITNSRFSGIIYAKLSSLERLSLMLNINHSLLA